MKKIWKDIPGYEGLYQVSNYGEIRNNIKLLSLLNVKGYYQVILSKNGVKKHLLVHRLVWITFIGEIPEGHEINHIDENGHNNSLSNLSLVTHKENCNWGTAIKRRVKKRANKVFQYDIKGSLIKEWVSAQEVHRTLNYYSNAICECCNGKRKTAYGFIWRYNKI